MVIDIKKVSKLVENNAQMRKLFTSTVSIVLYTLEAQRLLDGRMIQKSVIDWDKGTFSLGDNTINMLVGRAISQYVIDSAKDRAFDVARGKRQAYKDR